MKLFICTATKQLTLVLFENTVIDEIKHLGNNDHSKTLMPFIDQILKKNKLELSNIEEIIVSIGPGSYTGVRIAVVVAKTLALFKNIKLTKVSSLEAMASGISGFVAPSITAKKDYVFGGIYEVKSDKIIKVVSDKFMLESEYEDLVKEYSAKKINSDFTVNPLILSTEETDVYSISPEYLR